MCKHVHSWALPGHLCNMDSPKRLKKLKYGKTKMWDCSYNLWHLPDHPRVSRKWSQTRQTFLDVKKKQFYFVNNKIIFTCRYWKSCQLSAKVTTHMTSVLTLSKTIRVVALSSLVTLIPAKLKKAILRILPRTYWKNKSMKHQLNILRC